MIKNIDKKKHMHTLLKLLLDFKKIQIIWQSFRDDMIITQQQNR